MGLQQLEIALPAGGEGIARCIQSGMEPVAELCEGGFPAIGAIERSLFAAAQLGPDALHLGVEGGGEVRVGGRAAFQRHRFTEINGLHKDAVRCCQAPAPLVQDLGVGLDPLGVPAQRGDLFLAPDHTLIGRDPGIELSDDFDRPLFQSVAPLPQGAGIGQGLHADRVQLWREKAAHDRVGQPVALPRVIGDVDDDAFRRDA